MELLKREDRIETVWTDRACNSFYETVYEKTVGVLRVRYGFNE